MLMVNTIKIINRYDVITLAYWGGGQGGLAPLKLVKV